VSANQYAILTVAADHASQENWTHNVTDTTETDNLVVQQIRLQYESYQRLEKEVCIQEYATQYLASRGNVILVSTINSTAGNVLLGYRYSTPKWNPFHPQESFNWICNETPDWGKKPHCDVKSLDSSNWEIPAGVPLDYCLSKKVPEHCRVYFNSAIMIVVISSNLVKLLCMVMITKRYTTGTLVTVGDAIASFLESRDRWTEHMSLATKDDFENGNPGMPRTWEPRRRFWYQLVSWQRWLLSTSMYVLRSAFIYVRF
jgi:hypothetical protein